MDDYRHQVNFKIGNHMTNHRFSSDQELADFLGFKIAPTPEMILAEMARLEKKLQEIYRSGSISKGGE